MLLDWGKALWSLAEKRKKDPTDYLAATVSMADVASSRRGGTRNNARELIARVCQDVMVCGERNGRTCANQALRLYMPKGRSSRKWTRGVKSRTQIEYLKSRNGGPGLKSSRWAEYAGDIEEVMDHPVLDLLSNPNPFMSGTLFSQAVFQSNEWTGNAYIHCVQPTETTVSEMWIMLPQHTWIMFSRSDVVGGYGYGRDGAIEDEFEPDEVMHHKHAPSLSNPFYGIGPLHAVFAESDIQSASVESELAMWRNGARPDWVLSVPPEASADSIKTLQSKINSEHRGPRNRGKMLVTQVTEVKPLQFTPREMEYTAGKNDVRQSIWAAFGVPESEMRLNDANLASSESGSRQYMRQTIKPRIDSYAEFLTNNLLPKFGIAPGEMWFAYDNPVVGDVNAQATRLVSLVSTNILTRNEARADLGYDAVDGGDEFREPQTPDMVMNDNEQAASNAAEAGVKAYADRHIHTKDDIRSSMTQAQERAVASMADAVKRVFEKQPTSVRNGQVVMPGLEVELAEAIRPFARAFLQAGITDGAEKLAAAGIDAPMEVEPVRALEFLNQYTIRLARGISQTTQNDLRSALATGAVEGETLADMNVRVANALGESAGWRAERIARTESTRMHSEGARLGWKDNGIEQMRFILSAEPCEQCVAVAEKYQGPQPIGTDGMMPPVHPQCRCAVAPVVDIGGGGAA